MTTMTIASCLPLCRPPPKRPKRALRRCGARQRRANANDVATPRAQLAKRLRAAEERADQLKDAERAAQVRPCCGCGRRRPPAAVVVVVPNARAAQADAAEARRVATAAQERAARADEQCKAESARALEAVRQASMRARARVAQCAAAG